MKALCTVFLFVSIVSCNANALLADQDEQSVFEKLSFVTAIKDGDVDRFRELINDQDVNMVEEKTGRTALHYVAEYGNEKLVELLIQKGADVNFENKEGLTSMHFAALNENEKVMEKLIKSGGEINKASIESVNPIHLASLNSNENIVEKLLRNGANTSILTDHHETLLHWSVLNSNEKVTDLLIKKGIPIKIKNKDGDTALHLAGFNSNEKIAELLIKKAGADVDAVAKGDLTPSFNAVLNGNKKFKDVLVDSNKVETYARQKALDSLVDQFMNPIQENAGEKILELLIQNGGSINQMNGEGNTPYDVATLFGDEHMMEFLVKHGAISAKETSTDPQFGDLVTVEREIVAAAAENGNIDRFQELIKDRDLNVIGDSFGNTALHYIADFGNERVIDILVKNGANVNFENFEGLTPLHFAASNGNEKIMASLIENGGDINKASKSSITPLYLAALNSNEKIVELLLSKGANTSILSDENESALHWSALNANEKVTDLLIKSGIDIDTINSDGQTALHLAAFNQNEKIPEMLIRSGANVNAEAKNGWTPIFCATLNGNYWTMNYEVLYNFWNAKLKNSLNARNRYNTHARERFWDRLTEKFVYPKESAGEKIIELLVQSSANINHINSEGKTPLDMISGEFGDEKRRQVLLKFGATSAEQRNEKHVEKHDFIRKQPGSA